MNRRVAGINETTFYRWLKRGATAKSGKFCRFRQSLEESEAANADPVKMNRLVAQQREQQAETRNRT